MTEHNIPTIAAGTTETIVDESADVSIGEMHNSSTLEIGNGDHIIDIGSAARGVSVEVGDGNTTLTTGQIAGGAITLGDGNHDVHTGELGIGRTDVSITVGDGDSKVEFDDKIQDFSRPVDPAITAGNGDHEIIGNIGQNTNGNNASLGSVVTVDLGDGDSSITMNNAGADGNTRVIENGRWVTREMRDDEVTMRQLDIDTGNGDHTIKVETNVRDLDINLGDGDKNISIDGNVTTADITTGHGSVTLEMADVRTAHVDLGTIENLVDEDAWLVTNPSGGRAPRVSDGTATFNRGGEGTFGDSIQQDINTNIGIEYTLKLDLPATGGYGVTHHFEVQILDDNGNVLATETGSSTNSTAGAIEVSFVPTTDASRVVITNTDVDGHHYYSDGRVTNIELLETGRDSTGEDKNITMGDIEVADINVEGGNATIETGEIGRGSITVGDGDHNIHTGELGTGMNDVSITVGDGNSCIEFDDQIQMVNTPRRVDPDINAGDGNHKIIGNIGQNTNGTTASVGSVVTVELGDGDSSITMNNAGADGTIRVFENGRWVTRDMEDDEVFMQTLDIDAGDGDQAIKVETMVRDLDIDLGDGDQTIEIDGNVTTADMNMGDGEKTITTADMATANITMGDGDVTMVTGTIGAGTITAGDGDHDIHTGELGTGMTDVVINVGDGNSCIEFDDQIQMVNQPRRVDPDINAGDGDHVIVGNIGQNGAGTIRSVGSVVTVEVGDGDSTVVMENAGATGQIRVIEDGRWVTRDAEDGDVFMAQLEVMGGDGNMTVRAETMVRDLDIHVGEGDHAIVLDGAVTAGDISTGFGSQTLFADNITTANIDLAMLEDLIDDAGWTANNGGGSYAAHVSGGIAYFNRGRDGAGDSIEQEVETNVGVEHTLSLDLPATGGYSVTHTFEIQVLDANGDVIATETASSTNSTGDSVELSFVPTTTTSKIVITNSEVSGNHRYSDGRVSNIELTATGTDFSGEEHVVKIGDIVTSDINIGGGNTTMLTGQINAGAIAIGDGDHFIKTGELAIGMNDVAITVGDGDSCIEFDDQLQNLPAQRRVDPAITAGNGNHIITGNIGQNTNGTEMSVGSFVTVDLGEGDATIAMLNAGARGTVRAVENGRWVTRDANEDDVFMQTLDIKAEDGNRDIMVETMVRDLDINIGDTNPGSGDGHHEICLEGDVTTADITIGEGLAEVVTADIGTLTFDKADGELLLWTGDIDNAAVNAGDGDHIVITDTVGRGSFTLGEGDHLIHMGELGTGMNDVEINVGAGNSLIEFDDMIQMVNTPRAVDPAITAGDGDHVVIGNIGQNSNGTTLSVGSVVSVDLGEGNSTIAMLNAGGNEDNTIRVAENGRWVTREIEENDIFMRQLDIDGGDGNHTVLAETMVRDLDIDLGDGDRHIQLDGMINDAKITLGDGDTTLVTDRMMVADINVGDGDATVVMGQIDRGSMTFGDGNHDIHTGELGTGMNDVTITVGDGDSCIEFDDQVQMVNTPRLVDPDINAGDGNHVIVGNIGQNTNGTTASVGSVVTVEVGDGDTDIAMLNAGATGNINATENGRWVNREMQDDEVFMRQLDIDAGEGDHNIMVETMVRDLDIDLADGDNVIELDGDVTTADINIGQGVTTIHTADITTANIQIGTLENLIENGDFSDGSNVWLIANPSGSYAPAVNGGAFRFNRGSEGTFGDSIQQEFNANVGVEHTLSLDLPATGGYGATHTFRVDILDDNGDVIATETASSTNATAGKVEIRFTPTTDTSRVVITNTDATAYHRYSDGIVDNVSIIETGQDFSGNDTVLKLGDISTSDIDVLTGDVKIETGQINAGSITVGDGDHVIHTGELGVGTTDVVITVGNGDSCIEFNDQIQIVNNARRVDPDINAGDGNHTVIGNIGQNTNGTTASVGSVVSVDLGEGDSTIAMLNAGADGNIQAVENHRWVTREMRDDEVAMRELDIDTGAGSHEILVETMVRTATIDLEGIGGDTIILDGGLAMGMWTVNTNDGDDIVLINSKDLETGDANDTFDLGAGNDRVIIYGGGTLGSMRLLNVESVQFFDGDLADTLANLGIPAMDPAHCDLSGLEPSLTAPVKSTPTVTDLTAPTKPATGGPDVDIDPTLASEEIGDIEITKTTDDTAIRTINPNDSGANFTPKSTDFDAEDTEIEISKPTLDIRPRNEGPDAVDDTLAINEGELALADLLANDSDPEGDALQILDANGNAAGTSFTVTSTDGRDAAVIVAADGALNFALDTLANFDDLNEGETDTVTVSYTISDGNGLTDTANVTVTINGEGTGGALVSGSVPTTGTGDRQVAVVLDTSNSAVNTAAAIPVQDFDGDGNIGTVADLMLGKVSELALMLEATDLLTIIPSGLSGIPDAGTSFTFTAGVLQDAIATDTANGDIAGQKALFAPVAATYDASDFTVDLEQAFNIANSRFDATSGVEQNKVIAMVASKAGFIGQGGEFNFFGDVEGAFADLTDATTAADVDVLVIPTEAVLDADSFSAIDSDGTVDVDTDDRTFGLDAFIDPAPTVASDADIVSFEVSIDNVVDANIGLADLTPGADGFDFAPTQLGDGVFDATIGLDLNGDGLADITRSLSDTVAEADRTLAEDDTFDFELDGFFANPLSAGG